MVDITAISGALVALRAANDIAQAMIGLRDTAAFQTKLIEFQTKIIEANNSAFAAQEERTALLQQISDLEKQVAGFEAWETEKQRYELKGAGGAFFYDLKPDAQGSEPPHKICANCYQNRKKSILQIVPGNNARTALGARPTYRCSACKSEIAA